MTTRPLLAADSVEPRALASMARFHASTLEEVRAAVARDDVVIVGMAQNPHVRKARNAFREAGIPFTYLEYGSYLSGWKKRLAIKRWSGWPTFPQVFVKGMLFGGASDAKKALADGSLKARLGT